MNNYWVLGISFQGAEWILFTTSKAFSSAVLAGGEGRGEGRGEGGRGGGGTALQLVILGGRRNENGAPIPPNFESGWEMLFIGLYTD